MRIISISIVIGAMLAGVVMLICNIVNSVEIYPDREKFPKSYRTNKWSQTVCVGCHKESV